MRVLLLFFLFLITLLKSIITLSMYNPRILSDSMGEVSQNSPQHLHCLAVKSSTRTVHCAVQHDVQHNLSVVRQCGSGGRTRPMLHICRPCPLCVSGRVAHLPGKWEDIHMRVERNSRVNSWGTPPASRDRPLLAVGCRFCFFATEGVECWL